MKKILSLLIVGLLCLSTFSTFAPKVKAQEIGWNTNPTPMPVPLTEHASVVYNGKIYVLGGSTLTVNWRDTVYFADILPDGTIGGWMSTTPLPEVRADFEAVSWNGFVYVLGGSTTGGAYLNTVSYAQIQPDGTLGGWMTTTSLPTTVAGFASAVWNGRIYVIIGGWPGGKGEVYYAEINPNGPIGDWNPTSSLPALRRAPATIVRDSVIYVIGGQYPSGEYHSTVYFATINPDGSVGAWSSTDPLPDSRENAEPVLYNDDIYVIGGNQRSWEGLIYDTVFSASVDPDGTIASWTVENSLPEPRTGHACVVSESIIYVLGGTGTDGYKDTIYYSSPLVEELLSLPAEAYYRFPGQFGAGCVLEWMDRQMVIASPGESVTFSIQYHIWNLVAPAEIKQAFFIVSWTPSWPPSVEYYIPIYDGNAGLAPGITGTTSFSVTVPDEPGEYFLWWCTSSHFSMGQAVEEYTTPLALPGHAKIVVSSAPPTRVYVDPSTSTANVGAPFSIDVKITDVIDLYGFDLKLGYDTSVLTAIDIVVGDFFYDSAVWITKINDTAGADPVEKGGDPDRGYAWIVVTVPLGTTEGVDGSGTLATVTFTVDARGESILNLYGAEPSIQEPYTVLLIDSNAVEISRTVVDGYFSNVEEVLTTISVEPSSIIDPTLVPGEVFTVNIMVTNVIDLYGVDFKLAYDTCILTATNLDFTGNIFIDGEYSPDYAVWAQVINDTAGAGGAGKGRVWVGLSEGLGEQAGVNGSGRLVRITFTVDAIGESNLDIFSTEVVGWGAMDIPHSIDDGYFSNIEEVHTTVSVNPPSIIDPTKVAGTTFSVDINIADVKDLFAYQFRLSWKGPLLNVTSVVEGPFLKTVGSTFFIKKIFNSPDPAGVSNYILVGCTRIGEIQGVSGSGTLATVTLFVEETGQTVLDLYDTILVNYDAERIPHTVLDGLFTNHVRPDFLVHASPSTLTLTQEGSGTSTITVTSLNNFDSPVGLSVSILPTGFEASFNPPVLDLPANGSVTSILVIDVGMSVAAGMYSLTVTGTGGTIEHSVRVTLEVSAVNNAPEIHSVEVVPHIAEQPTIVTIKVNATDFEDGTDILVKSIISIPNGTVQQFEMTFDTTFFTLNYPIYYTDPTGDYTIIVVARDSEGALASSDPFSFKNAIVTNRGTIQGTVTDKSGSPIFNVTLILRRIDSYLIYRNSTDTNGRHIFNKVLPGNYVLEASAKDFAVNSTSIEAIKDQTTTANLTLSRLPIIYGYVRTKADSPIPRALVTVSNIREIAGSNYTDESGFYRVAISSVGTFAIKASKRGYALDSSIITVMLESITQVNFTLAENGIVKGQVQDPVSGLPIPNTTIYLGKQTYLGIRNFTDDYGNFSFSNVMPGDYVVRATARGYLGASSSIAVAEGATIFVELRLMPTGNITGTIRDSDTGTPISRAKVALLDEFGTILVVYVTGTDGTYLFQSVEPGNYILKAYAYGYNSTIESVDVEPYETRIVDFNLVTNSIFADLHIPSLIYSRGETIRFTIDVTNPLGESIAENVTDVQLVLIGPSDETISINMSEENNTFTGNHTIPSDASIGIWVVVANVTDIHGNIGEDIEFVGVREAFHIQFTTSRKSYIETENATFYATVARYSNLNRLLTEQDVNVTLYINDQSNNTLAEFPMTFVNNTFYGTHHLAGINVGNYTVFLTVDDGQGNTMTQKTLFKVVYDFSVLVSTNKFIHNRTETVKISGWVDYVTGDPVANTAVRIELEVKGYARIFSTTTGNDGRFEYNFTPTGFDSGNYILEASIIANHIERKATSTFVILGLILNPPKLTVEMSMNSANNVSINIGNIGETLVTGIDISITPSFDEVNATVVVPPSSSLAPGQWSTFTVRIASDISTSETVWFNVAASTDQGAFEYGIIEVKLYPATPVALVHPQIIDISLTLNSQSMHRINITNIGYGTMNNVYITEPSLSWISTTLADLGNINAKESKALDIIITPTSNLPVGVYEDQISILSDNHQSVNIYLIVTITSSEKGSLLFHVFDELDNHIADARIMLQYQEYYFDTLSGKANATGQLLFDNLSIGRYSYFVEKEGHDSISGVAIVYPGKSVPVEVLLPSRIMDVSFTIEPITIQDQYIITLNLTFQAEIPPPVLLPIPSVLEYWADRADVYDYGHSATGEVSIFNTGLIQVSNINIDIEYVTSDSRYCLSVLDFEENIPAIDAIEAKSSVRIPIDLNIEPGVLITELPSGLVGKIKIQGTFIYFDPGSDIPRTAVTESEVLVFIFDTGDRRLCVNPRVIYGIKQESVVSFLSGSWPERLPDVTITNCDNFEKVSLCPIASGGGITVFIGLDLIQILLEPWKPLDLGGFVVTGFITRYGGLPGEEDPLVDAEDFFGLVSVGQMHALRSLLVQALINTTTDEGVIRLVDLSPGESAILQSEMWSIPTSWSDLFQDLFDFRVRIGVEWTIGGVVFSYQWEHDTSPSFYLIPIFIIEVYAPSISIPLLSGPGGAGAPSNGGVIPYDGGYIPFPLPSVTYPPQPTVRKVPPRPVPPVHETVRLYISQRATLERDAFLATLIMKNKSPTTSIENVEVNLKITDQDGADVTDSFFIDAPSLENINAIDGTGTIDPDAAATVQWTVIPKPGAGGTDINGKYYFVQAFISYTVAGMPFSVNSTKEIINVKPQPLLVLDYYVPSEVRADAPFKLAVKVTNIGSGTARDFEIESAQPVIYDNISGLLISFRIVGSAVKGQPAGNSMRINFGDIPPGTSVIAYWVMVSSLDGVFLDFSASFTHTNELGGAETSLIHSVKTHILMRDVMDDDVTFLFLIDADSDGTPDELIDPIFGDGTPIVDVEYTVDYTLGTIKVQTQKYEGYWIWVEVDDQYNNQIPILKVVRSDGKILNPMNYWMANGKIYFVDDAEESYTIVYEIFDADAPITSVSFNPETPNGQNDWYTMPVQVTLIARDEISGVATTHYRVNDEPHQVYTIPLTISDDGIYTIHFWSIDNADNIEAVRNVNFRIDRMAPTTLLTIGEPQYVTDPMYVSASTSFILEATDTLSGVNIIEYKIDSGSWTPYFTSFNLLDFGSHTVHYRSIDIAGNIEATQSATVFLDNTPPTTTLTIGEPKYAVDITSVTCETPFTLEADDNSGSGLASIAYRILNSTYDTGWLTYTVPFRLTALFDGIYSIEFNSTDNVGNMEPSHAISIVLDNAGPSVAIVNPPAEWALQDGVIFVASIIDTGSGVFSVNFSIREANGGDGKPVGFEDLQPTYNATTDKWILLFDTLQLPDGYYVVLVNAQDNLGHMGSTTVPYSIRNWAVLELLPATKNNRAGRTMPVKFFLRVAASVDPNQPFVYNEELAIKIYATNNPAEILQESTFGDTARDYRINSITDVYITNFQTSKTPMHYTVSVCRGIFLIGSFDFKTVRK